MATKTKVLWMKVSDDKYELPMAVADSRNELAKMVGVEPASITRMMSRARNNKEKSCYVKVVVDDEDY